MQPPLQQNANVPPINSTVHSFDHFLLLIWGAQETMQSIVMSFLQFPLRKWKRGGDKERGYSETLRMLPGCMWSKRLRRCSLQVSSSYSCSVIVCGSESGDGGWQRGWGRGANAQLWRQRDEKSRSKIRGSINRLPGSARMFGCDCRGNEATQPGPWTPAPALPIVLQGQRDRVGVSEHTWAEDASIFHTTEPAAKAPRLSAEQ